MDGGSTPPSPRLDDTAFVFNDVAATEMMAGVAAPLLAAAAVAITGVVVQQPESLRWPGVTLLLLLVAATLLITAVQLGFLARRHTPTSSAVDEAVASLPEQLRETQRKVAVEMAEDLYEFWADKARWTYSLGIVFLWLGLATAVMPGIGADQPVWRWVVAAFVALMALLELAWMAATRVRPKWFVPARALRDHGARTPSVRRSDVHPPAPNPT